MQIGRPEGVVRCSAASEQRLHAACRV